MTMPMMSRITTTKVEKEKPTNVTNVTKVSSYTFVSKCIGLRCILYTKIKGNMFVENVAKVLHFDLSCWVIKPECIESKQNDTIVTNVREASRLRLTCYVIEKECTQL